MVNINWVFCLKQASNGFAEIFILPIAFEKRSDTTFRISDNLSGPLFVPFADISGFLHTLKGMAEGPVAEIMQQSSDDGDVFAFLITELAS